MNPWEEHALEKWMSRDDFQSVRPYLKCYKNRPLDLANLFLEEHVEIYLGMELIFDDWDDWEDVEDDESTQEYMVKYDCLFKGKTTNTFVDFSTHNSFFVGLHVTDARDMLLKRLISLCTSVKRLTIRSSLTGLPPDNDRFRADYGINEEFQQWADIGLVLRKFGDAAFWSVSLEHLELLGDTVLPLSDEIDTVLTTTPRNLKVLRLECDDSDDYEAAQYRVKRFVQKFPTIETLRLYCRRGQRFYNFNLPRVFEGMATRNPNLKTIQIHGDEKAINLGGASFRKVAFELPQFDQLEHLTIDVKGPQKYEENYADVAVAILRITNIKEVSFRGLRATHKCFDFLISHLERDDCSLQFFDIDKDEMTDEQLEKLIELLSLEKIPLPYSADLKTLDTLLVLRRFWDVIPQYINLAAKLWPYLLANAAQRKTLKGMTKDAASRWFFSQFQVAPSLLYSLLRSRVDILTSSYNNNSKKSKKSSGKRPHDAALSDAKKTPKVDVA